MGTPRWVLYFEPRRQRRKGGQQAHLQGAGNMEPSHGPAITTYIVGCLARALTPASAIWMSVACADHPQHVTARQRRHCFNTRVHLQRMDGRTRVLHGATSKQPQGRTFGTTRRGGSTLEASTEFAPRLPLPIWISQHGKAAGCSYKQEVSDNRVDHA